MNKKTILLVLIMGLVVLASISAVSARKADDACVPKPPQQLGVAAVTEGISFILAGGVGPLIILAIAFIIGLIISYVMFSGF